MGCAGAGVEIRSALERAGDNHAAVSGHRDGSRRVNARSAHVPCPHEMAGRIQPVYERVGGRRRSGGGQQRRTRPRIEIHRPLERSGDERVPVTSRSDTTSNVISWTTHAANPDQVA